MRRFSAFFGILFSVLLLSLPTSQAQDGLLGALSRSGHGVSLISASEGKVAAADFDSDEKPDGAVLLPAGQLNGQRDFRIEFHVTGGRNTSIQFSSPEAELSIAAVDVNRDGAPDIVIEKAFSHERVQVYLNNGRGEFKKTSEKFVAPDDSGPQWRAAAAPQNLLPDSLSPTRGFELAATRAAIFTYPLDASRHTFWRKAVLVGCGACAPSPSRAPPSLTSL